jgi:hypothetical protein
LSLALLVISQFELEGTSIHCHFAEPSVVSTGLTACEVFFKGIFYSEVNCGSYAKKLRADEELQVDDW